MTLQRMGIAPLPPLLRSTHTADMATAVGVYEKEHSRRFWYRCHLAVTWCFPGAHSAGEISYALLHQVVGHVLAHRPPQEAKDMMGRVCTKSAKSAKYAFGTLDAHFVMSKWYTHAHFVQT